MVASNLYMIKIRTKMLPLEITTYQPRVQIPWVSIKFFEIGNNRILTFYLNILVSYELIHNPQLYNSSKLGRDEQFAKSHGFDQKVRKSAYGSMSLSNAGQTVARNIDPTCHWKSTYKNVVDELSEKDRIVSRRPLWSINR